MFGGSVRRPLSGRVSPGPLKFQACLSLSFQGRVFGVRILETLSEHHASVVQTLQKGLIPRPALGPWMGTNMESKL